MSTVVTVAITVTTATASIFPASSEARETLSKGVEYYNTTILEEKAEESQIWVIVNRNTKLTNDVVAERGLYVHVVYNKPDSEC